MVSEYDGHGVVERECLRQSCVQLVDLADGILGGARDELLGADVATARGGGAHLFRDPVLDGMVPAELVEE
jgi:hypothetical protein